MTSRAATPILAGIGLIFIAASLGVLYHAKAQLREREGLLDTERNRLAALAAENENLSNQLAAATSAEAAAKHQLEQLRQSTRQKTPTSRSAAPPAVVTATAVPADPNRYDVPRALWANAGFATPAATLQTRGWAVVNADRDLFKQSLVITDNARKILEDMFLQMAAAVKNPDPDTQRVMKDVLDGKLGVEDALLMPMTGLNQNHPFTGYRVLSQLPSSEDERVLQVETGITGAPARTETMKFRRFGADWKIVIDEDFINEQIKKH